MAIVDYFLKLDGIPGESADKKHKDEIQIERFVFALKSPRDAGTGQATGRRQYSPVHFEARVNKSSPKLMIACATNQKIGKAVFVARRPGKAAEEYYTLTLTNAFVCHYSIAGGADLGGMAASVGGFGESAAKAPGGAEGSMIVPLDTFEMTFQKIEITYKPYAADGTPGGPVTVADDWNSNAQ